jgi:hypothetical protein
MCTVNIVSVTAHDRSAAGTGTAQRVERHTASAVISVVALNAVVADHEQKHYMRPAADLLLCLTNFAWQIYGHC